MITRIPKFLITMDIIITYIFIHGKSLVMPKHRQCCAKEDEMVKALAYAAEKEFKYTFVIHIPCREL